MCGFDTVFDTSVAADLTIVEEAAELVRKLENGENTYPNGNKYPLFTSCCPGWVRFVKTQFPAYVSHLSTAKSPQQMFGAVAKSYFAQKLGVDPHDIFVVSIMPCTAKKSEAALPTMRDACGDADVDVVLTTREIVRMFRGEQINPAVLDETPFDSPLGSGTGAAVIFGATGGVMEAALRTVADVLEGKDLESIEYTAVRGLEGIKEATVQVAGMDIKVAIAHGTANAGRLLNSIRKGERTYHFIEIMGCPGGCVTGGGQPIVNARTRYQIDPREARAKATYECDRAMPIRKSHQNPSIHKLYGEFLEKPGSHKAHALLHTTYVER